MLVQVDKKKTFPDLTFLPLTGAVIYSYPSRAPSYIPTPHGLQFNVISSPDRQMSRPANVATGKCRDRQMSRPANVATGKCRDRQMSRPANVATGKSRDRQNFSRQMSRSANVATGKCRDRQMSRSAKVRPAKVRPARCRPALGRPPIKRGQGAEACPELNIYDSFFIK